MKAKALALISAIVFSTNATAQPLPQLYDVTGVGVGDQLNIRAEPSADAAPLGTLPRDARAIEVVALNEAGTWGQVNTAEASGWVNMRYMDERGVHIDHYNLPDGLFCMGTEPFWSAQNIGGRLHYDTPDAPARDMDIWIAQDSGIEGDLRRMLQFAGIGGPGMGFIYPAQCSDGMSDRAYGLAISLMTAPDAPMLSGCCTLSR